MTFLPIVERELLVASRRHATYSTRLVVALVAIVIGIFLYIANLRTPKHLLAHYIFQGLSILALFYCLAAGRRSTADCLSEEKREGTLGLLFLTKLKGYDVVLGKLAATSLNSFFCLLAIFPVLAVPLLMGGITNGEFWRMVLVLANTFLFSLAVGIFSSALSQNARRAMGANFLWFLLLGFTLPACGLAIAYFTPSHLFLPELLLCCPVYSFYLTVESRYPFEIGHFWWSIAVVHALTWLLIIMASRILPRIWQDRPAEKGKIRFRDRLRAWAYGNPAKRKALRKRLLDINPFLWLASRAWFKPLGVWLGLAIITGWWFGVRTFLDSSWHDELLSFTTALLLNSLLKLWVAVEAGQRLADDQKIGALELLLSTPLTVRDILRGQFLALRRQFLGPLIFVVAVELGLTFAVASHSQLYAARTRAFGEASLLLLAADLAALCWVAIASALTAKNPNQASVNNILRILILPWVAWLTIITITNVWLMLHGSKEPGWKFYLYLWVWLGLIADAAFGLPAWWRVRTRFRELALQRISSSKPVA
jgi:ABC-type transport system involved in multi-copper enzyme maturation permease subunit